MNATKQNPMGYIAALDGMRAVAIIAVLIFHVSPQALSGGFIGVDVFFVLSGFLITSIILHDVHDGSFSMREFYLRRVQRLLPNAMVSILAVLLLWTLFMPPGASRQPGVHGLWTLFNLSNIYIWRYLGGYWGAAAETAPLTHFWSLGIEEQFYILFPASLLFLLRVRPRLIQFWLVITTLLSFGLSLYGTYARPAATFYLMPTRVWELLVGAVLAAHFARARMQGTQNGFPAGPKAREAIGWAGLGMIAAGFFFIGEDDKFPGLVSLAPVVGTAFVLLSVTNGETRLSRLLSTPAMVKTGMLSYSLYLWHWPLIVFGQRQAELRGLPQLMGAAAGGVGSILVGWVAYKCIEQPLRKRGAGRSWRLAVVAGGFCLVALCCAFTAHRHAAVDPGHRFDRPSWSADLFNSGVFDNAKFTNASFDDMYLPPMPRRRDDTWRTGGIVHLYGGDRPKVVVFGSSHALMYSRLIDELCREMGVAVAFLGMSFGESALFEARAGMNFSSLAEAREFDEARKTWLAKWHPETLIVIDCWDARRDTPQGFDVKLRSFLEEVSPLVGRVIFTAQVPVLGVPADINLRGLITWRMNREKGLPRLFPDANEGFRKQAVTTAAAAAVDFPKLRLLRPDLAFYHDDGSVRYAAGRSFFYADGNHLTDIGTEEVRVLFHQVITEALAGSPSP